MVLTELPDGVAAVNYKLPGFGVGVGRGPGGKCKQLLNLLIVNLSAIQNGGFCAAPAGDYVL